MMLTLRIENFQTLEGGSPVEISSTGRPVRVGRATGMDWVLPDPTRFISSHHFDVEFQGGAWWLTDRSTNGTFLLGQPYRLDGPHRLSHGDRFQVGQYFVGVVLGAAAAPQPGYGGGQPQGGTADPSDPWAVAAAGAPVDPMPRSAVRRMADFSDEFIVTPVPAGAPPPWPGSYPAGAPPAPVPQPAPYPVPGAAPPPAVPMPMPVPLPQAAPVPHPVANTGAEAMLRAFCEGAGIPADAVGNLLPEAFAHEMGRTMRIVAQELMALLQDRASTKKFTKGGDRTMMGATNNNPLKFMPDAAQALDAMFLTPREGFLKGGDSVAAALSDVRLHQMAVFAAIQPALIKLLADLAPEAIDESAGGGILSTGSKRKAWETYVERWDAKAGKHENGMLDAFLLHFTESYTAAVASFRKGRENG